MSRQNLALHIQEKCQLLPIYFRVTIETTPVKYDTYHNIIELYVLIQGTNNLFTER